MVHHPGAWELKHNKGYGGMAGHYLLIRKALLSRLARHGIPVGTGFINSGNCLYREINRGVTWLFSNRAAEIQRLINPNPAKPDCWEAGMRGSQEM